MLAFVESISRGFVKMIEPKPKPQTHLWATGQCGCVIHIEEGTVYIVTMLCIGY